MQTQTIDVWCENNSQKLTINVGTTPQQILELVDIDNKDMVISAYLNNRSKDLATPIYKPMRLRYITRSHFEGAKVYGRTMVLVLFKACRDLLPNNRLRVKHSIKEGYYFEIDDTKGDSKVATMLKDRINELIDAAIPITREKVHYKEAIELFKGEGLDDKIELIESRPTLYATINRIDNVVGYLYGTLAINTSYLDKFDILPLKDGFYMALPSSTNPDKIDTCYEPDKMFELFAKYKGWNDIIDISTIGKLNQCVENGGAKSLIQMAEAMQENEFFNLAQNVHKAHKQGVQLVLIAGPSSSGKTTFSKRLMVQLKVMGLVPMTISIDDYFIDRDKTPLNEFGRPDYESLRSVDVDSFNKDLSALMRGERVTLARYDFIEGKRTKGDSHQINERTILIVEGIHALNPELTKDIEAKLRYSIYASALTTISMDNLARIGTTDNRLLRRMVRDHNFRGNSALKTLKAWGEVRRGESINIFPYQEMADYMFNTALLYELAVLKSHVVPLLKSVPDTEPEYSEARRLLGILYSIEEINDEFIPPTSILREFIGGSSFDY